MSGQEPGRRIELSELFDPRTLADAELDALIAEFARRLKEMPSNATVAEGILAADISQCG